MGYAQYARERTTARPTSRQQIWTSNARVGLATPSAFANPGLGERTANGPRDASGAQPDQSVRLRRRRRFTQRFICIGLALAPQQWRVGFKESDRNPSGASRPRKIAANAQEF